MFRIRAKILSKWNRSEKSFKDSKNYHGHLEHNREKDSRAKKLRSQNSVKKKKKKKVFQSKFDRRKLVWGKILRNKNSKAKLGKLVRKKINN